MPIFFAAAVAAKRTDRNKTFVVFHDMKIRQHYAVTLVALPVLRLTNQCTIVFGILSKTLFSSTPRKSSVGSKARECCQKNKKENNKK
jgi:hypothetical protein